jgi:hypothetical protein
MSLYGKLIDLFITYSPEREAAKKLAAARFLLVEHECQREFYEHSTTMLKARIKRIEGDAPAARAVPASPVLPHAAFSHTRSAR